MAKPGMPYLDIIRMVRNRFDVPVFACQVSGEYALIEAAVAAGVLDRDRAVIEVLKGFKRRLLGDAHISCATGGAATGLIAPGRDPGA